MRNVCIIHFNTPELTEAAILSLRRHGGENYNVFVFDNSNERPFTAKMNGVTVFDNTQGQFFDWAQWLLQFPERNPSAGVNNWGSDMHMVSVQMLFDLVPDGFLLMDSDVLLKANVDFMFREDQCAVGHIQQPQPGNYMKLGRLVPMLCYINVPMCRKCKLNYFDPHRSWMLHPNFHDRRNWYDTGASFLEDLRSHRHGACGRRIDIRPLMEHYKCGSWRQHDIKEQAEWLSKHRDLWEPTPLMRGEKRVAVCAIGRNENRYAKEWVEHYKSLGVAKIFIYDNYFGDETPLAVTLADYVKSGLVEITDIHDRPNLQTVAYDDCYRKHGNEYAWIGFLDFDEFLRWNSRKKITTMLSQYTDCDVVLINWRLMTDGGLVHYDDRPLSVRFKVAMQPDTYVKYDRPENDHVKSFVRGGLGDIVCGVHVPLTPLRCVNTIGQPVSQQPFVPYDHSIMRIDHYWTKTAEEWRNVKLARGFSAPASYTTTFMRRQRDYFFAVNEWSEEKEKIITNS